MTDDKVRAVFAEAETIADDQLYDDQGADPRGDDRDPGPSPDDYAGEDDGWRQDLPPDPDEMVAKAARFPLNDYGNGQRLKLYYGDDMLFVPRLGWYRWGGKFWAADEDELTVRRDAQKIAGRILEEVPHLHLEQWEQDALDAWINARPQHIEIEKVPFGDRTDEQKQLLDELNGLRNKSDNVRVRMQKAKAAHRSHAKNTGNTSKITNMLMECRVAAATTVDALNADPMMVNCQNGILHFVREIDAHDAEWGDKDPKWRVEMMPHDREYLISKMMLADYDPEARCPYWIKFLETVLPDPEVRTFMQRWFGLTITGIKTEQKLAFLFGVGRNGKSTMVDTIARIMADYGTTIPIETLTGADQRKGSDATPDLVRLPGARMVRASEPEQGQRMKEALIKSLTGGEAIMIRRMQQEFVEIVPEFKLTISGNYKPDVRGADDGIWRRIMLVNFGIQIPEDEVDETLPEKLWAERDGIFAWLVSGCLDYLENGLKAPEVVRQATAEYREESDPLRLFLLSECEITGDQADFETSIDLANAFNAYLLADGLATWTPRHLSLEIKKRSEFVKSEGGLSFEQKRKKTTGYIGIRISSEARSRIEQHDLQLTKARERSGG